MQVIPLKYGAMFKRAFSDPEVFTAFANDILGIQLNISEVHTEYEYPQPIGFVRSQYDLFAEDVEQRIIVEIQQVKEGDFFDRFLYYHLISLVEQVGGFQAYGFERTVYTIVVLTSVPRDGSMNFSCAISDMSPVTEQGETLDVYPHRLLFLCPRQVNDKTPPAIKKWLDFIADSLDGEMNTASYPENMWQKILAMIQKKTIDPQLLSEIKDEQAWTEVLTETRDAGIAIGLEKGLEKGREEGRQEERQQIQHQTVQKARKMGLDDPAIAELTGLTLAEIQALEN
jgi:predicted transposase/invertase (TIGR01784 family)